MRHQWITGLKTGKLYPVFCQEVTPGDIWQGRSTGVFRLAPMNSPAFVSMDIHVKYFFVRHSNIWDDFENEITGQTTPTWPTITLTAGATPDLFKQFGVTAPAATLSPTVNALPIRAYNSIYNHHFKPDHITARTEDQVNNLGQIYHGTNTYFGGVQQELQQGSEETIDTSNPTLGVTAIREAFNRQRQKERRALYGERYIDMLRSDYGVKVPDSRLDRPIYLGGSKATMGISEVVATATSAGENTGEYRGHGIVGMNIPFRRRRFPEHGLIIGVAYAKPRLQLSYRIDKQFRLTDLEDLYIPSLSTDSMIGLHNTECHSLVATTDPDIGYVGRYDHLRKPRDTISQDMLDNGYNDYIATPDLSVGFTIDSMQSIDDYDGLFQDTSSTRNDVITFIDHKISKISCVKPEPKR